MNIYETQVEKMKKLMVYGTVNEQSHNINKTVVEYQALAADGKTYGIVRENHKFYIKNAPKKNTEVLAEDFDYIGGFNNRKANEYDNYPLAAKQLELKLISLNEAYAAKKPIVEQFKQVAKSEWMIEESKAMQNEIDRQRQIMRNASGILNEDAKIPMNREVPEAPATNPSEKVKNGPYTEKATAKGDKDTVKLSNNHAKAGKPFDQTETVSDSDMESDKNPKGGKSVNSPYNEKAKYAPKDSVADQKPKGGKSVKMNEIHKIKISEEQVLTWNNNKDYLDTAKGTKVGSSAPFDEVDKDSNQQEADTDSIQESDGSMFDEGDNINKPKPGNGEIGKGNPFDKNVKESDETDEDPELNEGFYMDEDFTDMAGMPDQQQGEQPYSNRDLDFERQINLYFKAHPELDPSSRPQNQSNNYNGFDTEFGINNPYDESKKKKGKIVKEESETVLDDFGKHPAYQKTVMTLPPNKEVAPNGAKDWNDKSVDGDKPYGLEVGSSAPFDDIVKVLTDSVMKKLSQMKLASSSNSEKGNTDGGKGKPQPKANAQPKDEKKK